MRLIVNKHDKSIFRLKNLINRPEALAGNYAANTEATLVVQDIEDEKVSLGFLLDQKFRYITVNNIGTLEITRKNVGKWETFKTSKGDGFISIDDHHGNQLISGDFEFTESTKEQKKEFLLGMIKTVLDEVVEKHMKFPFEFSENCFEKPLGIDTSTSLDESLLDEQCELSVDFNCKNSALKVNLYLSKYFPENSSHKHRRLSMFIENFFPQVFSSISLKLASNRNFLKRSKYIYCDISSCLESRCMDLNIPDYSRLIPDLYAIQRRNRAPKLAKTFSEFLTKWSKKKNILYWRGSTTGCPNFGKDNFRENTRYKVCRELSSESRKFSNCKFSRLAQVPPADLEYIKHHLEEHRIIGDPVPESKFNDYKFYPDLPGNARAWGTIFRYLDGSLVFRPINPSSYLLYDQYMQPWIHYLPVKDDFSDLKHQLSYAKENPMQAALIAYRGYLVARSYLLNIDSYSYLD